MNWRARGVALAAVGVALVLHPFYLWPHDGQPPGAITLPIRPLTTILAGLLIGVGCLLAVEDRPRPRSAVAAAWVPLAVVLALQFVETMDAGRIPVLNVGTNLTGLAIFVAPFGLGVALRRRARVAAVGFGLAVLLLGVASVTAWNEPQAAAALWAGLVTVVTAAGFAVAAPRSGVRSVRSVLAAAVRRSVPRS